MGRSPRPPERRHRSGSDSEKARRRALSYRVTINQEPRLATSITRPVRTFTGTGVALADPAQVPRGGAKLVPKVFELYVNVPAFKHQVGLLPMGKTIGACDHIVKHEHGVLTEQNGGADVA